MKNLPLLLVTIIGTLALIIGVAVMFSRSDTSNAQAVDRNLIETNAVHVRGPAEAKVTIVEFSDFQCPACKATHPLIKQVLATNPDQVRLIYRHFPLYQIHPYAQLSAEAAVAAGESGKFWEMHDLLFDRQQAWSTAGSADGARDMIAGYAEELGIDKAQFLEKMKSESVTNVVTQDVALGTQLSVGATPTLYVNGQPTAPDQLPSVVANLLAQ